MPRPRPLPKASESGYRAWAYRLASQIGRAIASTSAAASASAKCVTAKDAERLQSSAMTGRCAEFAAATDAGLNGWPAWEPATLFPDLGAAPDQWPFDLTRRAHA